MFSRKKGGVPESLLNKQRTMDRHGPFWKSLIIPCRKGFQHGYQSSYKKRNRFDITEKRDLRLNLNNLKPKIENVLSSIKTLLLNVCFFFVYLFYVSRLDIINIFSLLYNNLNS